MRFLCLLFPFLLASCGRADAAATNVPTLTAEVQGDSTRVVARWTRPCDAKGCADRYRVIWQWRTGARDVTATTDTMWYATPRIGDTLAVSVTVHAVRRGIEAAPRSAQTVLRNPDTSPPPVDSLRVDTLSIEAALLDSFPAEVTRTENGYEGLALLLAERHALCRLARNRYDWRDVRIVVDPSWTDREIEEVNQRCERARALFIAERDG